MYKTIYELNQKGDTMKITIWNILIIAFLAIGLGFYFTSIEKKSENNTSGYSMTKPKLEVNVELNKTKFKLDDVGKFTVEIKNIGETPIFIYKDIGWGTSSGLSKMISDEKDELILGRIVSDAHYVPPFLEKDFIKLEKGEYIRKERWLDVYSEGISKPGDYKLVVFYSSPVPKNFAPKKKRVWTTEDGEVESNTISFTVIK